MEWRVEAPTAPDTLACYPFITHDPFVIQSSPDVFFAGNQPEFATKLITQDDKKIRVICVPDFSKTNTIVLLNLNDLSTHPINFSTEQEDAGEGEENDDVEMA